MSNFVGENLQKQFSSTNLPINLIGNANQFNIRQSETILNITGNGNKIILLKSVMQINMMGNGNVAIVQNSEITIMVTGNGNEVKLQGTTSDNKVWVRSVTGYGNTLPPSAKKEEEKNYQNPRGQTRFRFDDSEQQEHQEVVNNNNRNPFWYQQNGNSFYPQGYGFQGYYNNFQQPNFFVPPFNYGGFPPNVPNNQQSFSNPFRNSSIQNRRNNNFSNNYNNPFLINNSNSERQNQRNYNERNIFRYNNSYNQREPTINNSQNSFSGIYERPQRSNNPFNANMLDQNPNRRLGLSNLECSQLPKSKHRGADVNCTICFEAIKQDQQQTYLFCFHSFHSNCCNQWLKKSAKCPICQINVKQALKNQLREQENQVIQID